MAMNRRDWLRFPRSLVLWLGLLVVSAPVRAEAGDTARESSDPGPSPEAVAKAREHFLRAEKLYKDGAFEASLVELFKAYEIAPSYRILYNIGIANLEIGDYAAAIRAFQQYLAEGGEEVPADRRGALPEKIRSLRDRVAYVTVETNEEGAEIFVDDIPVGRVPLAEPLLVNAGRRRVAVSLPDRPQIREVVTVAGGESVKVVLRFPTAEAPTAPGPALPPPAPPPTTAPSKPSPVEPKVESSNTGLWLGWTATGLLAAGTVVTGVLALSASDDLEAERTSYASNAGAKRDALDDAADRAERLGLVTDILGAAALVAGGVTLYATLASDEHEPSGRLQVQAAPGSLRVRGSF
jgi:hypothetical protein